MFAKVISGGQTGADRAALDVALELGLPCGGWCPHGRRAEDGPLDQRYPLTETPWAGYPQRTRWNIRDTDGTLILSCGAADRGTALTQQLAARLHKPCLVLDLSAGPGVDAVAAWACAHQIRVVNIAGPRESSSPGIYERAVYFLRKALAQQPRDVGASPLRAAHAAKRSKRQ
jgi:hypothetical protein